MLSSTLLGVRIHNEPKVQAPNMLAALPDMGNVAGIGISYLVKKLDAKMFAEIYSYWPPYVIYKNGVIQYEQSSYKFYYVEQENLIIFSGEFNPTDPRRLYEICYEVVRMGEKFGVRTLYSMGAALRQASGAEPKIFGAINNKQLAEHMKNFGIQLLEGEGQITGFNGLIMGIAKEHGMNAACILGEIDNPNIVQPKAAQTILKALVGVLGIPPLDMADLDEEEKRKQFMEQQMSYLQNLMERGEPPGIG